MSVTLTRKLIWAQPVKLLDFDLLNGLGKPDSLVVLEPERVTFYRNDAGGWSFDHDVTISHAFAWPRDMNGKIDGSTGKVTISDAECEGDALHIDTLICKQAARKAPAANVIDVMPAPSTADFAQLPTVCPGVGQLFLASEDGDWTHPDSLAVYEGPSGNGPAVGKMPDAISQLIEVPGPVLALGTTGDVKAARIVSRNLQTGMYEASIVSISCTN